MKNKKHILLIVVILLTLFTMACGFSSAFSDLLSEDSFSEGTATEEIPVLEVEEVNVIEAELVENPIFTSDIIKGDLADLYDSVVPGVVLIQVYTDNGLVSGSGFVYDMDGHIVTNYHIVEDAQLIEVHFYSGLKVYGEVIATDMVSGLAVMKVDVPINELHPLRMGSSANLRIGDGVIAIGNPYGLAGTITYGIVSAKDLNIGLLPLREFNSNITMGDIIQTDASITSSNSGGPLLNLAGEVVGVNRAIQSSSASIICDPNNIGIGFAISIDIVNRVVPVLIETGDYDYPYIGARLLENLTLLTQELLDIDYNTGVYITEVVDGSPADEAGLIGSTEQEVFYEGQSVSMPLGGDLIIQVDDIKVGVYSDLMSYVVLHKSPGDTITLTVVRNGEIMEIPLTLGSQPAVK